MCVCARARNKFDSDVFGTTAPPRIAHQLEWFTYTQTECCYYANTSAWLLSIRSTGITCTHSHTSLQHVYNHLIASAHTLAVSREPPTLDNRQKREREMRARQIRRVCGPHRRRMLLMLMTSDPDGCGWPHVAALLDANIKTPRREERACVYDVVNNYPECVVFWSVAF